MMVACGEGRANMHIVSSTKDTRWRPRFADGERGGGLGRGARGGQGAGAHVKGEGGGMTGTRGGEQEAGGRER